ncbi:four helix bundle protein [candidate division WS5 bacterium]|uniref:Four helix bundle protein n=1 Tax=candidate division WS5 bacterium TaxID=2093353 RepID=A0A419DG06_9BACT|nr:MAG: four helix bundle protein [candidate division WS5 bacterium]
MENEFSKITKFTDLIVWQEGHKLVLMIYASTKQFPEVEKYGLVNQIQRAVVSVTSNIAEGFTRRSSKEKLQFFKISQGSLVEVQNQILIAKDIGYLKENEFSKIAGQTVIVHKLINGLLKSTRLKKYE